MKNVPKKPIKLTLVIPAYNEERVIDSTLIETAFFLKEKDLYEESEVIVVAADGGDNTAKIAKSHAKNFAHFQLIEPGPKVGKGRDVALGVLAAKGEYIVFTDADLATPLHHVLYMFELLDAGNQMAIGTRNIKVVHLGLRRRLSSVLSNMLIQFMVAPGIRDTQCGFKGFQRDAARRIFSQLKINGWGFDFEVIGMARKFKYTIGIMDVPDWTDPKVGHGLVGESQIKAMAKTLKELFKVRINLWKGIYK